MSPVAQSLQKRDDFKHIYSSGLRPDDLLDRKILNLLIRKSLERPGTFFGLSCENIMKMLRLEPTYQNVRDTRAAIRTLLRVDGISEVRSSTKIRYFPSSKAIFLHGASIQRQLEDFA